MATDFRIFDPDGPPVTWFDAVDESRPRPQPEAFAIVAGSSPTIARSSEDRIYIGRATITSRRRQVSRARSDQRGEAARSHRCESPAPKPGDPFVTGFSGHYCVDSLRLTVVEPRPIRVAFVLSEALKPESTAASARAMRATVNPMRLFG